MTSRLDEIAAALRERPTSDLELSYSDETRADAAVGGTTGQGAEPSPTRSDRRASSTSPNASRHGSTKV